LRADAQPFEQLVRRVEKLQSQTGMLILVPARGVVEIRLR
jgi:hypothetical protein